MGHSSDLLRVKRGRGGLNSGRCHHMMQRRGRGRRVPKCLIFTVRTMLESPAPPPKWRSSFLDALEELVGGLSGTLEALEGHLGS